MLNDVLGGKLFFLIISLSLVIYVYLLVEKKKVRVNSRNSLDTLKERYIKGKITKEEYFRRLEVI